MKKIVGFMTLLSSVVLLPASSTFADATAPTTTAPAATASPGAGGHRPGEVNQRLRRQHRRIRQGVKKGQLTAAEAKDLRQHDQAIRSEETEMRKANGGKLTPQDKQKLNDELNQNSQAITQQKHN